MIENMSPEEFLKIVDKTKRVHFEYLCITFDYNDMKVEEIRLEIRSIIKVD